MTPAAFRLRAGGKRGLLPLPENPGMPGGNGLAAHWDLATGDRWRYRAPGRCDS